MTHTDFDVTLARRAIAAFCTLLGIADHGKQDDLRIIISIGERTLISTEIEVGNGAETSSREIIVSCNENSSKLQYVACSKHETLDLFNSGNYIEKLH